MKYTLKYRFLLVIATITIAFSSCVKEDEFSKDFDIEWPLPTITSISPETAEVGTEVTIEGTNLDKTTSVKIGGTKLSAEILEKTATSVRFVVPRRTVTGTIRVATAYKREFETESAFTPTYPETNIIEWPLEIMRGQSFKVKGDNMDLIYEVTVEGVKLNVDNNIQDEVVVKTEGIDLPNDITTVTFQALGGVTNGSAPIPVIDFDPSQGFDAVDAIVIWDFEDGSNPFVASQITPVNDVRSNAPRGRGANYLHISEANVPDPWGTEIGTLTAQNIDLAGFHEPHLTFMINTNGNAGYFQLEMTQGGNTDGGHFTSSTSSDPDDNYMFQTNDWEWRTIPIADFGWEDWSGDGFIEWEKDGIIDEIKFVFKQGNGSNPFEINIDQVMITDGAHAPFMELMTFENGMNPYSGNFMSSINGAGLSAPFAGENYLTVSESNTASWNWSGEIQYDAQTIDLSGLEKPYLRMAVNTGAIKGYFQVELFQDQTKWGMGQTHPDYAFETMGEWTIVNIDLSMIQQFSNWGGDATEFDPAGILDYVKIGFSSGNIDGEPYELNIDDIYISDGPLF